MKRIYWVGRSFEDLKRFPEPVKRHIGYALRFAQRGTKHPSAKPLKGFHGAGVLEIVESFDGNAYRVVYTVRFAEAIYVLHAFQKKSKHGHSTPIGEINLVKQRLKQVEAELR